MNHPTQNVLIDYLHGELPPGEDAAVLLHLEQCGECREEYDAQAQLSEAIHRYAQATEAELPGAVRAGIWQAIESGERASWQTRLQAFLRPAIGLGAAAAAALALAIGFGPGAHHRQPAIDAIYYLDDHAALTSTVPFSEGSAVPASLVTGQTTSDQEWLASSGTSDVAVDDATH